MDEPVQSNRPQTETSPMISVIIPARNEARDIGKTLAAILQAAATTPEIALEVLLIDNLSTDETAEIGRSFAPVVEVISCPRLKAPCARNEGVLHAKANVYLFVDADTLIPETCLPKIWAFAQHHQVGIFGIDGEGRSMRSRLWWWFWNTVRHLPLAHAKALPAFMFCTREGFDRFGPFDEEVQIGEEWPITARCWKQARKQFVYDTSLRAITSDRRMELQPFGYSKTFFKYVWAILHKSGRIEYEDRYR